MNRIKNYGLLAAGVFLIAATHFRFGIGVLGWITPLPLLLYLRRTTGVRSRLVLVGALMVGWSLATLKITTVPLSPVFALFYGVPLGLLQAIAYLGWDRLKAARVGLWIFPALMAAIEWFQFTVTPLGSWGASAYTQLENLPLLQLASLFGIPAISFVVHLIPSLAERWISGRRSYYEAIAVVVIIIAVHTFGALRLGDSEGRERGTAIVAAIGTDSSVTGLPLSDASVIVEEKRVLFERTRLAANAGAEIVVWPEAAIGIDPATEAAWQSELSALAESLNIELVAAYVVPLSAEPFRFENKIAWFRPDGTLDHTYYKHEPVPGEPAIRGTDPFKAVDAKLGRVGEAICYDYDFPWISREHGRLALDLVAVPASDWRGIDPIHATMTSLRAIEGGHGVVRSTRWGLSVALDAYGRIYGRMSDFNSDEKVMVATMPISRINTLYSRIGDAFVLVVMLFPLYGLVSALNRKTQRTNRITGITTRDLRAPEDSGYTPH